MSAGIQSDLPIDQPRSEFLAPASPTIDNLRMSDGASFNLACGYNVNRLRMVSRDKVDRMIEDYEEAVRRIVQEVKRR